MEARPCPILEFFNGTKQMLVPLFQRPYEWEHHDWETLWADLLERYEDDADGTAHFTGAIVTAPARSVPVGVSKHLVIDGQQRLTTVALLICAIRTLVAPESKEFRKLTRLLVNEDEDGTDHYKLLPTQEDRPTFCALVERNGDIDPSRRMARAVEFFRQRLQGTTSEGVSIDLERLTTTLQSRLTVVSIHLGDTDDPYLIFESLNAKGTPLTQADLIRNYLLLRLRTQDQEKLFTQLWRPMQELLGTEHLTEFMRQYLMLKGEEVMRSAIYSVLKKRLYALADDEIPAELERMRRAATLYGWIVGVGLGTEPKIDAALARLRRWEVSVASPFLLKLLDAHAKGTVTTADACSALQVVESYVVRRYICRVPTNQLKRIFLALTRDFPAEKLAIWLTSTLAAGGAGRRWPKDDEFRDSWQTYRAYVAPIDRCKFILERMEATFAHKETVDPVNATIEHVMPQTLSAEWRSALGDQAESTHERWLDCLGNLTLTAYNSELSNSPFDVKRKLFDESHFELNRGLAATQQWTGAEIELRGLALFERAKSVWARPMDAPAP